jgi:hypothetical protein
MGIVVAFTPRAAVAAEEPDIDLFTAVDAAIRDLRDIARHWGKDEAREQVEACREMLERAYFAAE